MGIVSEVIHVETPVFTATHAYKKASETCLVLLPQNGPVKDLDRHKEVALYR